MTATSIAWTRAAALLRLPRANGWPATLEPLQAAALQTGFATPLERREAHLVAAALTDACRAGVVACEAAQRTVQPKPRMRKVGTIGQAQAPRQWAQPAPAARVVDVLRIGPHAFAEWLRAEGLEPAPLVVAWQASQDKPASSPAPVADGRVWTPERIAAARAMRDKLKAQGLKDYAARTAAAFGVNTARLRQVLGPDESHPKPPALVGWPVEKRRVHRAK